MKLRIISSIFLGTLAACGDLSQDEATPSAADGPRTEGPRCESGESSRPYNLKFLGCVEGQATYEVLDHDRVQDMDFAPLHGL